MRHIVPFLAASFVSGLVAIGACSSSGGTGGTTAASTSATAVASSSSSSGAASASASASSAAATTSGTGATTGASTGTTGAGGSGGGGVGGGGAGGGATNPFECAVPATPPSKGSCVAFPAGDGGVGDGGELDAGLDDAGNASVTTCNPITNAGCTGTDICYPDPANKYYYCQGAGSVAVCGDCTMAYCGIGGLCVGINMAGTAAVCGQMCCTDSDCGAGKCDTGQLQSPLPSGVGLCIP